MNDERAMLVEAVTGVIARHAVADETADQFQAPLDRPLWTALAEHGFTLVAVPEEAGGAGASLADAAAVLRVGGATAVAVPLAETLLVASWLLTETGLPIPPEAPITVAPHTSSLRLRQDDDGWRADGRLPRVPWARDAAAVVVVVDYGSTSYLACLPPESFTVTRRVNMAGEARDDLVVDARLDAGAVVTTPSGIDQDAVWRRGALARAVAMVGALERARDLTVTYVGQREQFGRRLSQFQAVQQQLAELVAEVAAASAAVDMAVEAEAQGAGAGAIAVAKIRVGRAAGIVGTIAHQLHGAIGATDEYELHLVTRRMWSWRDEFGSEAWWSLKLGRDVTAAGGDRLWPMLTAGMS